MQCHHLDKYGTFIMFYFSKQSAIFGYADNVGLKFYMKSTKINLRTSEMGTEPNQSAANSEYGYIFQIWI